MPLAELLAGWRPGSYDLPWSWDDEVRDLVGRVVDPALPWAEFVESVRADGIQEPVSLGPDGRVWDGHHRVCAAIVLGLDAVPVVRGS